MFTRDAGCINRGDPGPALPAAKFVSEVVMCLGFDEEDSKKGIVWQLPQELFPYVDAAVGLHGALIVEV